ncbi:DUF5671 domain-containing protein [Kallotenue papyrolyticum]|uniref:DUF5671 domain-containing protein n=1 Tax=Kallotenue papyrolyticum TaxID=1325125 RepID=UPI00047008FB|nr:DUF5671 domain-containing protein [Kallotenue papyrolyticum]
MNIIVVRRVYLYSAALIGLLMLAAGLRTLVSMLLEMLLAPPALGLAGAATRVSLGSALVIVGGLLWAGHWWWAQRSLTQPDERSSALRRLYGYLVLGITMLRLLFAAADLLALALGAAPDDGRAPSLMATLLVDGVIWLYHWRILGADRVTVEVEGAPATLRRWYLVVIQAVSLTLAGFNAARLLTLALRRLLPMITAADQRAALIYPLAGLIAGVAVWLPHHRWALRLVQRDAPMQPDEARSTLRQVYGALVVSVTAIIALSALATLLYGGLLALFGVATDLGDYLEPLAAALVSLPLWWYHRQVLLLEGMLGTPPTRAAVARRINGYLLAAIGLLGVFVGLATLLTNLLRLWLLPAALGEGWQRGLSLGLALTLVALPVYAVTSYHLEGWTRREPAEERTLARRVYLYGALLALLITVIVALVALLQELLARALGAAEPSTDLSPVISVLLVGLPLLGSYLRLLRRAQTARSATEAQLRVALVVEPEWAAPLAAALRRELPGVQLQVAAPDDAAQVAAALNGAELLISSLTATWRAPTAAALGSFGGRRLVLATPLPDAELIGAPSRPDALAHALTRRVRELLAAAPAQPPASPPAAAPHAGGEACAP